MSMKELCQRTWKKARNVYNKVRQWKANYKCEAGGNAVHPAEMGRTMRESTLGYAATLASSVDGGVALVVAAAIVLCGVVIIVVNNRSKRK